LHVIINISFSNRKMKNIKTKNTCDVINNSTRTTETNGPQHAETKRPNSGPMLRIRGYLKEVRLVFH